MHVNLWCSPGLVSRSLVHRFRSGKYKCTLFQKEPAEHCSDRGHIYRSQIRSGTPPVPGENAVSLSEHKRNPAPNSLKAKAG